MKLCKIKCKGLCQQEVYVIAERFDIDGFPGIYLCPVCKDRKMEQIIRPVELNADQSISYRSNIVKGANERIYFTPPLVEETEQGPNLSIRQFRGSGRGDNESGEGPSTKPEEQAYIDDMAIRPRPSPYEAECSKYLGLPPG